MIYVLIYNYDLHNYVNVIIIYVYDLLINHDDICNRNYITFNYDNDVFNADYDLNRSDLYL